MVCALEKLRGSSGNPREQRVNCVRVPSNSYEGFTSRQKGEAAMKPFDDLLPEERDPQYEELITLLQQANHNPMLVDSTRRSHPPSRAPQRVRHAALEPPSTP